MFFITLGQKLDGVVWLKTFVYSFYVHNEMYYVYVLCTLPMYHLSTHDRNLYTFAQSTQCLYIRSYFMSRMIFFFFLYMCMCQILPENNEKKMTRIIKLILCVSIGVSVSVLILLLVFFQCERNKSPCRKQLSELWRIKMMSHHTCSGTKNNSL